MDVLKATASNAVIAQLPRYLFETIAFGGIVVIVLYYLQAGEGLAQILPTISLYAFAGYRLMPELQQLFGGVAAIRFNRAALDDLTDDMGRFVSDEQTSDRVHPLPFTEAIRLDEVTFRYAGSDQPALDAVSLTISRNQTVGLVGVSGSGKTTLVDLLLGLYEPEAGQILIDDTPLTTRPSVRGAARWVTSAAHLLCDDTIANNIAFGVPPAEVDRERVERAARIAHLHDFIRRYERTMNSGGERGVRLCGGHGSASASPERSTTTRRCSSWTRRPVRSMARRRRP